MGNNKRKRAQNKRKAEERLGTAATTRSASKPTVNKVQKVTSQVPATSSKVNKDNLRISMPDSKESDQSNKNSKSTTRTEGVSGESPKVRKKRAQRKQNENSGTKVYQIPKLDLNQNDIQKLTDRKANNEEDKTVKSGRHTNRALKGIQDDLLQDLNSEQKEYIIKELYPSLQIAMKHFIKISMQTEEYNSKIQKINAVNSALNSNKPAVEETKSQKQKLPVQPPVPAQPAPVSSFGGGTSAFGGFKMGGGATAGPIPPVQAPLPPAPITLQGTNGFSSNIMPPPMPQQPTRSSFGGFSMGAQPQVPPPTLQQPAASGSGFGGFSMGAQPQVPPPTLQQPAASGSGFGGFSMGAQPQVPPSTVQQPAASGSGFGGFSMGAQPQVPLSNVQQPAASGSGFGGFSMGAQPPIQQPPAQRQSSFGNFQMNQSSAISAPINPHMNQNIQPTNGSVAQPRLPSIPALNLNQMGRNMSIVGGSNSQILFMKCFDDVVNKRISNLNPGILGNQQRPSNFIQKIPGKEYREKQRHSVFQKVDLDSIDSKSVPIYKKSKQQLEEIIPLLKKNFLTQNLLDDEIIKLAGAMKPQKFLKNERIIKYGDVGSTYYILAKGSVRVILYNEGTSPNDTQLQNKIKLKKFMGQGAGFGELALLYNDKRSATIEAVDQCEVYTLDGTVFKTMIIKSSIQRRANRAGFLDQVKLFTSLDKFQKLKLIDGLQSINFFKGEAIIREGDVGEEFYIIEKGSVECLKLHHLKDKRKGFILVRSLNAGDHFGEIALIKDEPRSLTIRAKEDVKLLRLDKETFTRILGTIEGHLMMDYDQKFDKQLADIIQNKRTFSQTFDKSYFVEIRNSRGGSMISANGPQQQSCDTIIRGNNEDNVSGSNMNITMGSIGNFKSEQIQQNPINQ